MTKHQIQFVIDEDDADDTWWHCNACDEDVTGYGLGDPAADQAALAAGEHQLPAEVQDELAKASDESIEAWRDARGDHRGGEEGWPGGPGQPGSLAKRIYGSFTPVADTDVVDPFREGLAKFEAPLVCSRQTTGQSNSPITGPHRRQRIHSQSTCAVVV